MPVVTCIFNLRAQQLPLFQQPLKQPQVLTFSKKDEEKNESGLFYNLSGATG